MAGMKKAVEVLFKQHGIDGITTGKK